MVYSPPSLFHLCGKYAIGHLELLCDQEKNTKSWRLRAHMVLPRSICEALLRLCTPKLLDDNFVSIFGDPRRTNLQVVYLDGASLSDAGLGVLLRHNVDELYLIDCLNLTGESLKIINGLKSLRALVIINHGRGGLLSVGSDIHISPHLKKLVVYRVIGSNNGLNINIVNAQEKFNLRHLDISGEFRVESLALIPDIKNVTILSLHDTIYAHGTFSTIMLMTSLRSLDVSRSPQRPRNLISEPQKVLQKLVETLTELTSLDISGTNLAQPRSGDAKKTCAIAGLESRVREPFEMLGLYNITHSEICSMDHIPAMKITGKANEPQFLTAILAYSPKANFVIQVLQDYLYFLKMGNDIKDQKQLFDTTMKVMHRHRRSIVIQRLGIELLGLMNKNENLKSQDIQRAIPHILDVIEMNDNDWLLITHFNENLLHPLQYGLTIVHRHLFCFLLRLIISETNPGVLIIFLHALSHITISEEEKEFVGAGYKAIKEFVWFIGRHRRIKACGILEGVWDILYSLTDGVPENCKEFINSGGVWCFIHQFQNTFIGSDCVSSMVGVLVNITRVRELIQHLLEPHILQRLFNLLYKTGFEVRFQVAEVISFLAYDNFKGFGKKKFILNEMAISISQLYPTMSHRFINHPRIKRRSFRPILRILDAPNSPVQCQYWAVWALAHFIHVHAMESCSILRNEDGVRVLTSLLKRRDFWPSEDSSGSFLQLTRKVLQQLREN